MLELKSVMLLLKKSQLFTCEKKTLSIQLLLLEVRLISVEYENEFDLNESMEELLIQMNKNYLQQRV